MNLDDQMKRILKLFKKNCDTINKLDIVKSDYNKKNKDVRVVINPKDGLSKLNGN